MKRILIVDDDGYLAGTYQVALAKAGFEVRTVPDGAETQEALETFTPDLITLDLVMPIKDGLTTLSELKSKDSTKDIPVIIVTNFDQEGTRQKCLDLGAKDYLIKGDLPIETYVDKIETFLQ